MIGAVCCPTSHHPIAVRPTVRRICLAIPWCADNRVIVKVPATTFRIAALIAALLTTRVDELDEWWQRAVSIERHLDGEHFSIDLAAHAHYETKRSAVPRDPPFVNSGPW